MGQVTVCEALDRCLNMLKGGAAIEECLACHPEHASRLRPLLEIAAMLQSMPCPVSDPASFIAGKQRMLKALARTSNDDRVVGTARSHSDGTGVNRLSDLPLLYPAEPKAHGDGITSIAGGSRPRTAVCCVAVGA